MSGTVATNSVGAVIVIWVLVGVLVVMVLAGAVAFNRFVRQRNLIDDSWSNIDTELTRRYGEAKREGRRQDASFLSFCGDTLRIELPRFRRLSESEARAEMTTPVQDMAVAS